MNFYDIIMNPIEMFHLGKIRKKLISKANGNILEIGLGTGANLKHYDYSKVDKLTGLDIKISKEAKVKTIKYKKLTNFELVESKAEKLLFKDNSFDTVVITLVLCSVSDLYLSISEIKRVLKPNGKLLFIEHVMPDSRWLANIFNKLNKYWSKVACGCEINRITDSVILNSGMNVVFIRKKYKGVLCFGVAKKLIEYNV